VSSVLFAVICIYCVCSHVCWCVFSVYVFEIYRAFKRHLAILKRISAGCKNCTLSVCFRLVTNLAEMAGGPTVYVRWQRQGYFVLTFTMLSLSLYK
jgi:hypothetical protein